MPSSLGCKNIVGPGLESLAEVEVNGTHCSPLAYKSSHSITSSKQVGQA